MQHLPRVNLTRMASRAVGSNLWVKSHRIEYCHPR